MKRVFFFWSHSGRIFSFKVFQGSGVKKTGRIYSDLKTAGNVAIKLMNPKRL
jgi:hypothetical protein